MKSIKISILLIFLFCFFNNSFAQKFLIGPEVGYSVPSGDYGGTTLDYYAGTKYGLGSGVDFGLVFKAALGPINLNASGNYSSYSNSGNSEPGQGAVDIKQHILTFAVGPEFAFTLPGSPVKPYIGADLLFSNIGGEVTFTGVEAVPSGRYDMQSASRTGLGIGAGVRYSFSKKYALDFNLGYKFINLFGKKFEDINPSDDRRLDSYLSLNDDADPLYNPSDPEKKHPIGSSRSIALIQLNVAFLFGLGL